MTGSVTGSVTGSIRIGTSGWVYGHWRDVFYPERLPQSRWFAHYAGHFSTVEINATFYREPRETAVEGWRDQAPPAFVYAVKAHRFMTHMKKLLDCAEPVRRFFGRAELLGDRLGPILYQIAPQVPVQPERLAAFAALLPREHTHVFEFRDDRWFTPEVRDVLARADLAFCIHDAPGLACPDWVTAKTVYYRFHGPPGARPTPAATTTPRCSAPPATSAPRPQPATTSTSISTTTFTATPSPTPAA